jgi:hypothetical protein
MTITNKIIITQNMHTETNIISYHDDDDDDKIQYNHNVPICFLTRTLIILGENNINAAAPI